MFNEQKLTSFESPGAPLTTTFQQGGSKSAAPPAQPASPPKSSIFGNIGRSSAPQTPSGDEDDLDSLPSFLRRRPRGSDDASNDDDSNDA